MTYSLLIKQKTDNYLRSIDPNDFNPQDITIGLLDDTCDAIRKYNKKHDTHWTIPNDLLPYQIASIIANLHHAALIVLNSANIGSDHAILAIYNTTGPNKGLYTMERDEFLKLAYTYKPTLTSKEFDEVLQDEGLAFCLCISPEENVPVAPPQPRQGLLQARLFLPVDGF